MTETPLNPTLFVLVRCRGERMWVHGPFATEQDACDAVQGSVPLMGSGKVVWHVCPLQALTTLDFAEMVDPGLVIVGDIEEGM